MFEIRPVTESDAHALFLIEEECFPTPWSEKQLQEDIASPSTVYLCAVQSGKICGYGGMWRVLDDGSITNIAVLNEYRNQGIASAILMALLDDNVGFVTLEVRRSNSSAISLYEKHGFTVVGVRRNYYANPDGTREDAYLMAWKKSE